MLLQFVATWAAFAGTAEIGVGTVFGGEWDRKGNPDPGLACYRGRPVRDTDLVVAHPTLPCRSRVLLYNPRTKKSAVAHVGDRGPRNAMVDMTRRVAKRLGLNGMETVVLWSLGER